MKKEKTDGLQTVCYRAGDKNEDLELKEEMESEDCLPDSLIGVSRRFPGRV